MRDAGTSAFVATSLSLQKCKKKNAERLRQGSLSAENVINIAVVPNYGSSDMLLDINISVVSNYGSCDIMLGINSAVVPNCGSSDVMLGSYRRTVHLKSTQFPHQQMHYSLTWLIVLNLHYITQ